MKKDSKDACELVIYAERITKNDDLKFMVCTSNRGINSSIPTWGDEIGTSSIPDNQHYHLYLTEKFD